MFRPVISLLKRSFAKLSFPRLVVGLFSGFYLLFTAVHLWQLPLIPIDLAWRPDLELVVVAVKEEAATDNALQPNDIITAVDGAPVKRLSPIFVHGKPYYMLTVLREGSEKQVQLKVIADVTSLDNERFPLIYLSIILWGCGVVMISLRKPTLYINVLCGFVFLLLALGIISLRLALTGVLYSWVLGHTFGFICGAGLLAIGFHFEDRQDKTPRWINLALFSAAALASVIALVECVFLYPQKSLQQLFGISWVGLSITVFGVGLLGHYFVLIIRYNFTSNIFLKRQIRTLLYFVTLGSAPIFLIVILPRQWFYDVIEVQRVAFIFFSLVPLGYVYAINRTHHQIDPLFVNITIVSSIAIILWVIYGVGHLITFNRNTITSTWSLVLFVLPFLLIIPTLRGRLRTFIETLVYGPHSLNDRHLESFSNQLALAPEMKTVNVILEETGKTMRLERVLLVLVARESWLLPPHNSEYVHYAKDDSPVIESLPLDQPVLRTHGKTEHPLFLQYPWAACAVQLSARKRVIGALIISYVVNEPYLNWQQIGTIKLLSQILAVGYETIVLIDTSLQLNIQLQQVRDRERRMLASQLHDMPLQDLTMVAVGINQYQMSRDVMHLNDAEKWLEAATDSLRRICIGLHPPELEQGIEPAIREAVHRFRRKKEQVQVQVEIEDNAAVLSDRMTTMAIFHVAVESLNNVAKHSNATQVSVTLVYRDAHAILTIQDNGSQNQPFNASNVALLRNNHIGLISMQQWAQLVAGWVSIEAIPHEGVRVQLSVPVDLDPSVSISLVD